VPVGGEVLDLKARPVQDLQRHLRESLKLRVLNIPVPPALTGEHNVRVAVLFSGGLDCTVLARMAHDLLPPDYEIDLINVAFENPRVIQAANSAPKMKKKPKHKTQPIEIPEKELSKLPSSIMAVDCSPFESCPDRETGRKSFEELITVCPTRTWRFLSVS